MLRLAQGPTRYGFHHLARSIGAPSLLFDIVASQQGRDNAFACAPARRKGQNRFSARNGVARL
jgi:hypothetical protein